MKSIRVKNVNKNINIYDIRLTAVVKIDFMQKVKALAFLAQTNRIFTEILHEVNYLLIEVFSLYRLNWFYFSHNKSTMSIEQIRKDDRCDAILFEITGDINWIANESEYQDNFVKIITRFSKIFGLMNELIDILKNLVENKSQAEATYKLDSVLRRIAFCDNNISSYVKTSNQKIKLYSKDQ